MSKTKPILHEVSEPEPRGRSPYPPLVVATVCLLGAFWAFNHVYGDCIALKDIFTYCSLTTK